MVAADYNYASKKRPNTNHEDISYFASWNGVRLQIISNQQNVVQKRLFHTKRNQLSSLWWLKQGYLCEEKSMQNKK